MSPQNIHKDFFLNGKLFVTSEDLLSYTKISFPKIHSFLSNWFDTNDFIVVQTSGSTGTPKQLKLKKEFMVNSARGTGAYFNLPEKTSALLCLSPDYIAGKMMLVRALVLGWHIDVVTPSSHPLNNVNTPYDFVAMVPMQLQNSIAKLCHVKKMIVGGGAVSKDLQKKISTSSTMIFASYGMTETITHIAIKKLNKCGHLKLDATSHYQLLPNIKVSTDARNCLVIDAPTISDDIVVTNDIVEIMSISEFKWLGRYDTIINSGGIKLVPEQIEEKLAEVIDARFFVAGLPDDKLGEKLVLIVEQDINPNNHNKTHIDIKQLSNLNTLNKYEVPKEIFYINKFVETETKKIQRSKTLELLLL